MSGDLDSSAYVTIDLTDVQQRGILAATGIDKRTVVANRLGFVAMALAASAADSGVPNSMGCAITLVLTDDQRAQLAAFLAPPAPRALTFDADDIEPRFVEPWPDAGHLKIGNSHVIAFDRALEGDDAGRRPILLLHGNAEQAWGSGAHATTQICGALVEATVRPGDAVADVGSGSGILTIIAALRGAGSVDAFEIDPRAATATYENIRSNKVSHVAKVHRRALDSTADGPFDLTVANVFPRVLMQSAQGLARATRPGGLLVFSGVVVARLGQVEAALTDAGFEPLERRSLGSWCGGLMSRTDRVS